MGENDSYKRRAVNNFYCRTCGWFFGQSQAKEYANIQWEQSVDGVIDSVSFTAGNLNGYPCLEMDFTGAKAGTTLVTIQYDVNFHTRWNAGAGACPRGHGNYVQQYDDNWYHYEDQFYVTVTDESVQPGVTGNEHWVIVPANAKSDEVAKIELIKLDNEEYPEPVGSPKISDPNGIQGQYATVKAASGNWDGPTMYYYTIDVTVQGLAETPANEPVSIYVTYSVPKTWKYDSWNGDYFVSSWKTLTDKINIIVYEPDTVYLDAGESETYNYRDYMGSIEPDALSFDSNAITTNPNVLTLTTEDSNYTVEMADDAAEGSESTTKLFYSYYQTDSEGYTTHNLTCWVDVIRFVVGEGSEDPDPTETPVIIVKEFDGLTEEQIPGNFSLSYTISDCGMCGEKTGTLSRGDATLVNSSGVPQLMWDVELPVVEHGNFTHTITFTEKNVNVAGYKAPVFSGNVVTLESLALDDDAPEGAKPVITVSNRYEPKDDVFVLSYDGMGGTGCHAGG